METRPLLSHSSPTAVVAYRAGIAISAQRFLADAAKLAQCLPAGKHVLNVCLDRYRFSVGLAACLMADRVSLLPSTHTPEVIRRLAQFAPEVFCLTDESNCRIDLPRCYFPQQLPDTEIPWQVPQIGVAQLAAIVFTSGSTGIPLPHPKTWGELATSVRDAAPRLRLANGGGHTLIGTVPAQHMYGLESSVLLPLLSGNAFNAERPFYPADICAAIAAVPRPRVLVSTPIHIRTLLATAINVPPLDLILSATAPLPKDLAVEAESTWGATLLEIYGSTETGQIATRRTATSATWHLLPDIRLSIKEDRVYAQGGHLRQSTPLCDVIEITGIDEFLLHGRMVDLVNVAGKRSSFGYLNTQLNAIPGVLDGAFFLPAADIAADMSASAAVARLAAVVVAPGVSTEQLTAHLRRRIDAVFLPRPLLLVDRLPRNATGKLTQAALQSLLVKPRRPQP